MPFTLAASYLSSPLHVVVFVAISIGVGVAVWAPFTIARRFRTFKCAAVFIGAVTGVLGLILSVAPVGPLLASAEAAPAAPSSGRPARGAGAGVGRSPAAGSSTSLVANMPVQIEPLPAAPAPVKPAAPAKPVTPAKPAAAGKSVATATPTAPAKSGAVTKSGAVVKSGAPAKPAAPAATAGAVTPAGQATSAGPVKTATAVKTTSPAKPGAPAKAVAPVKTAATAKPAPSAKASAPEKPAAVAKAPVAAQPAAAGKPPAVASKAPAAAAPVAVVSDADLASPFTDEINAFSIQFPRAWKSGPIAGNPWVLEATDAGRAYISVGVQEMPGTPLPIATTLSNIAAHLRTQPDTVLHDSGTDSIQGHPYAWFRYTAPMPTTTGAARMTMVHYVIPMPSRALEVRMAATPDRFAALQPLMNRSMESFEILETRTADASDRR